MGDTLSEAVSAEGFSEDGALQGEEAAVQYFTVTLDANGVYFENECRKLRNLCNSQKIKYLFSSYV